MPQSIGAGYCLLTHMRDTKRMVNISTTNCKAVIFDFDDTLVATHLAIWDLHRYVAKKYFNTELSNQKLEEFWGRPIPELITQYYRTEDIDSAMEKLIFHRDEYPKTILPHVTETMDYLKSRDKVIGVVTAATRPLFDYDARLTGIKAVGFDYIQTAEDTDQHKPDPRVFNPLIKFMRNISIEPHEVIYVGDGLHDHAAAIGAGIQFIGVTTGLVTPELFKQNDIQHIQSLIELKQMC